MSERTVSLIGKIIIGAMALAVAVVLLFSEPVDGADRKQGVPTLARRSIACWSSTGSMRRTWPCLMSWSWKPRPSWTAHV